MRLSALRDASVWLLANKSRFPDGFTPQDLVRIGAWEMARYDGLVHLKAPQERLVVQMPEEDREIMRALGMGDFHRVTVYLDRVGPKRPCSRPRIPRCLSSSHSGVGRLLARMHRRGMLDRRRERGSWVYSHPAKRAVFGEVTP